MPITTNGREIILALAETVMGWKIARFATASHNEAVNSGDLTKWALAFPSGNLRHWQESEIRKDHIDLVNWNPLESIADAWMVVEQMRELGWYVRTEVTPAGRCTCCLWRSMQVFTERAESAPRAICLAVCAAFGISIPPESGQ